GSPRSSRPAGCAPRSSLRTAGESKHSSASPRCAHVAATFPPTAAGPRTGLAAALLAPNQVLEEEERIRRPLRQAAHQIPIPIGPERRRDEHSESAADEVELELRTHAVEHLELEPVALHPLALDEPDRMLDQPLVVRRDGSKAAVAQRPLDEADEGSIHV